jgi:DNA-binding transcriptional ArsR family regulator
LAQQQTALLDSRLARALSHPMRGHILGILDTRVASPNEIAELLGERLPNVSYHVRTLLDLGCIELVRTAQRRGAIEHYYRGVVRPFFDDSEWGTLPRSTKDAVSTTTLRMIHADITEAAESDTFEARADRILTRSPLVLDDQGWKELHDLLAAVLDQASRIADDSARRLARTSADEVLTKLVLMQFESPRRPEVSAPARAARKA